MSRTKKKIPKQLPFYLLAYTHRTVKGNISEAYKVQDDCLKFSESDSFDKNNMKKKVNDLVRLHEAM